MNIKVLRQPYPFHASAQKILIQAGFFGVFIFLFLALFQPFGLQSYVHKYKIIQLAGYGFITFLVLILNHFLFSFIAPKWYSLQTWTVGKNITYTFWIFFNIGLGNCIYSIQLGFFQSSLPSFILFQVMTLIIGVFPVTISTFLIYYNRLKTMLAETSILNENIHSFTPIEQHQIILIPSQNKSENTTVALNDLLYVKAIENYVELRTIDGTFMVRNTLKAIEQALLEYPQLKKCHRSYLVNLHKIKSFSGNAQGLQLHLSIEMEEVIPVSRAYVSAIKSAIKN